MTRNESNMSAQAVAWISLCVVLFGTQVLLENFPGAALAAAESNDLDANQVYAKRASWAESMIATRDNCALWAKGAKEGQVAATPLAAVWAKIEADWPTHAAWFRQDLPGDRYLDWFLQSNVNPHFERWIMSLALPRVAGTGAVLTHELDALVRDNIPTSDMRWLELYARTRRLEDLLATIRPIWLGDLRGDFERQAQELVSTQASSHDPRWAALQEWADRCRVPGKKLHMGTIAELPTTLALLAQALPTRFAASDALRQELTEAQNSWNDLLTAARNRDAKSPQRLPALADEIREVRRALVRSLAGMAEYLDQRPDVPLEAEWEEQFLGLVDDLANRQWFDRIAPQTQRPESLILPGDRDPADVVLRRTIALLADVKARGIGDLSDIEQHLAALENALNTIDPSQAEARYVLYADLCRVRREIAFRNPLLNFRELLFAKHHRAIYPHMCDQYYGIAAMPGGGLYVLSDPFGPHPQVRDVLADSVVSSGRLSGTRLSGGPNKLWNIAYDGMGNLTGDETVGGSFLSPDLSYDGHTIVFAYVECTGDRHHAHHTDPSRGHWDAGRCYHVFRVEVDGSNLVQLTDGTWNDFDPRWLPSGRIAMISERRGGYLRCGRVCPTYTLYDMTADGGDIRCLSPHETNEWHPSVTHDGRIAWTRWDYVDRHFSAAHMPWITSVDGCDPRPIHGNYAWRGSRPDMELNLRAIPDSPKFVATAAPHHGQAFGSFVIIDPRVRDDDGGSSLKRLTPEVGFPETADNGAETYGSAWPLSEDYYLCVYDANTRPTAPGVPASSYAQANYGIYLIDAFGNRELIYRDPSISCHQPIPLRSRPKPPVTTESSEGLAGVHTTEATVVVGDVYDSFSSWPEGTKIAALRVWQILPLSVAPAARNNGIQVPGTGSINTARAVLGTVPVESDGSAHFVVPAGKELFFQALDEQGLAVQSMRSGTHFQPGETRVCMGCHEPKQRAPRISPVESLATRRPPSRLQPDVDGTNPFSYARLVQPVLDKHCFDCHAKNSDKTFRLDAAPMQMTGQAYMDLNTTYTASYVSLAPQFGFYAYGDSGGRTHRTTPGQFGAHASKLYALLAQGHYDVKLPREDLHRLTVWLDSCSMFYGVYELSGGEAQLRGEIVRPTLE